MIKYPPMFNLRGIPSFHKVQITEAEKNVTRSGLRAVIAKVAKDGRTKGFSRHELRQSESYSNSSDAKTTRFIDEAVVDAAKSAQVPYWQFAAYLDSSNIIADLDTLAGTVLDLANSGDKFHLKPTVDVYGEAYALFQKRLPAFLKSMNDRQMGYLKDYWINLTETLSELRKEPKGEKGGFKEFDVGNGLKLSLHYPQEAEHGWVLLKPIRERNSDGSRTSKMAGVGSFWIAFEGDQAVMANASLADSLQGQGLGTKIYQFLSDQYGGLKSDSRSTSLKAQAVWKRIGATKTDDINGNGDRRFTVPGNPEKPPVRWTS